MATKIAEAVTFTKEFRPVEVLYYEGQDQLKAGITHPLPAPHLKSWKRGCQVGKSGPCYRHYPIVLAKTRSNKHPRF